MAKLYPPNIEGTIPAFYTSGDGTTIVVPFSMNRAVGSSIVTGVVLKVKKINTTEIILTKDADSFYADVANCEAYFKLSPEEQGLFRVGQYYRVQIAYKDITNTVGYYSTVGVVKYTAEPKVFIMSAESGMRDSTGNTGELDRTLSNLHTYDYIGVYQNINDPTEKLYSTRLMLFDGNNNILEDTGDVVHNVVNDETPDTSLEKLTISRDLNKNEVFKIQLCAKTINGVEYYSPKYRIIQREDTNTKFDVTAQFALAAISDYEQGIIHLELSAKDPTKQSASGLFLISRTEAKPPYMWKPVQRFAMTSEPIGSRMFVDYTVEQGKTYLYSLQQYNNAGIYSGRLISNEVWADFEDLFLVDTHRQLKIRLNPKVSSMRNNILEAKTNTIGSKYPFITRNGVVNHKEFSLSGLISYQMDDNRDFMSWSELGINQNITDLTSENIAAERDFKLEVLDWLTNPEPKILKSPTEGNYLVQLMGVSLSPNDTVGRMLHSFSCSASEIGTYDYDTLHKYGFIDVVDEEEFKVPQWRTISFTEETNEIVPLTLTSATFKPGHHYKQKTDKSWEITGPNEVFNAKATYGELQKIQKPKTGNILPEGVSVYSLRITDQMPGSEFIIQQGINQRSIYIGATGAYMAKVTSPISSIIIPEGQEYTGTLTYECKDNIVTSFDKVAGIKVQEVPARQFLGNQYWVNNKTHNILDVISDIKTEIASIAQIRFYKRDIGKLFVKANDPHLSWYNGKPSPNASCTFYYTGSEQEGEQKVANINTLQKEVLFKIYIHPQGCQEMSHDDEIWYKYGDKEFNPYTEVYFDPSKQVEGQTTNMFIEDSYNMFDVTIDDATTVINLEETEEYVMKDAEVSSIYIEDGIIAEMAYIVNIVDLGYEYTDPDVAPLREQYDKDVDAYWAYFEDTTDRTKDNIRDIDAMLQKIKDDYAALLAGIERAMMEDITLGGSFNGETFT